MELSQLNDQYDEQLCYKIPPRYKPVDIKMYVCKMYGQKLTMTTMLHFLV